MGELVHCDKVARNTVRRRLGVGQNWPKGLCGIAAIPTKSTLDDVAAAAKTEVTHKGEKRAQNAPKMTAK